MQNIPDEEGATPSRAPGGVAASGAAEGDDGGGGSGAKNSASGNSNNNTSGGGIIVLRAALGENEARAVINKWRVREGQFVSAAQILFLYQPVGVDAKDAKDAGKPGGDCAIQRYKSQRAGVVKKRLRKEGELLTKG